MAVEARSARFVSRISHLTVWKEIRPQSATNATRPVSNYFMKQTTFTHRNIHVQKPLNRGFLFFSPRTLRLRGAVEKQIPPTQHICKPAQANTQTKGLQKSCNFLSHSCQIVTFVLLRLSYDFKIHRQHKPTLQIGQCNRTHISWRFAATYWKPRSRH